VIALAAAAVIGWCAAALLVVELRRRSALVADAAHELRGPLTAIALGIEALRRQPAARSRAEALAAELCRMEIAADDAAAAARGRRTSTQPAPVALRDLLERTGAAWHPVAKRRGGRVTFDWRAEAALVRADRRRMAQAFGNLLANAVEHGGGEIVVRGRRTPGGIRVEVEDGGAGADGRVRVRRRWRAGRGRGLAIAARAVGQAGGTLASFESPGGGRVAVAELPADRPG